MKNFSNIYKAYLDLKKWSLKYSALNIFIILEQTQHIFGNSLQVTAC